MVLDPISCYDIYYKYINAILNMVLNTISCYDIYYYLSIGLMSEYIETYDQEFAQYNS